MPTTFIDGPAAGQGFDMRRAPIYLRVVQDRETGKWDALDQLHDEPTPAETVYVYRERPGSHGSAFLCGRGKAASGYHEWGIYEHIAHAPPEVRETAAWRAWVTAECAREGIPARAPVPAVVP